MVTLAEKDKTKPLGLGSGIAASSLLEHRWQGFSQETASLLRGNFSGKVAVASVYRLAAWAKCSRCSSMLVWIAMEVRCQ